MYPSLFKIIPLLVRANTILGSRSVNLARRMLIAKIEFAHALLAAPRTNGQNRMTGANQSLHHIDETRAYLRRMAEIISHETRALEADLTKVADAARELVDEGADGHSYKRRWRAKT